MIFGTPRLIIRKATLSDTDIDHLYKLWTEPRIMTMVGYPQGLRINRDDIRKGLVARSGSEFDCYLIVTLKKPVKCWANVNLAAPTTLGYPGPMSNFCPCFGGGSMEWK